MRRLLHILCFFSVINTYGQEIELRGCYGASFIGGESIEFTGKDSFYLSGFYCTYGVHGKGRCEIRDNFLYLYFEKNKTKAKKDPPKPPIIIRTENADSVSIIQITVADNNDIPIPYATAEVETATGVHTGTLTDTLGQATIKVPNDAWPIVVKAYGVGIEPSQLKLEDGANYTIKLFHKQHSLEDREFNNGEVFVYEIDELSEDLILMRPQRSSEPFRKYRKEK